MPQRFRTEISRPWSVRVRVIALVVAMLTIGLMVAGAVAFTVQFTQLNQRIESELVQEINEVREIARNGPPGVDGPYNDLGQLFEAYLTVSIPNDFESMVTLVDGQVAYIPGGLQPFDLNQPAVVAEALRRYIPGRAAIFDYPVDGHQLRMIVASVAIPGDNRQGVVVVGIDAGVQRRAIWNQVGTYALVALGVIVLTGATGYVVAGRLLRPVTDLAEATATIDTEDLTQRVKVTNADNDVAQLALTFNQMLDRLERGMADQRQFLDDAAHELRTPLTIIRGNLELMEVGDAEDVDSTRELVLDELDRMKRMVDDLLMLARSQRPDFIELAPIDVQQLGREIQDKVHLLSDHEWDTSVTAAGTVVGDRQRLQQAAIQLAANAAKFSEPRTRIDVRVAWARPTHEVAEKVAELAQRYLVISVEDHGVGISPEESERIFERFGRSEEHHTVEGSGLGLPIVVVIAEAHGGTVTVESAVGLGSTFRIWIPAEV
ncbi:HAMP domain-containing histidine kinase [Ornithinimicrobium sp. F0845]|uniref:sensor histidine kinase n=1 Tax=Ornithinimicrobium sp. F0845 TaxID=2926412 RepID=UPI001FF1B5C6|nr:HAMP domain-containing sensor histidine kinase [Ornithinimicrobium sp. F0845]MCK0112953.1 HAMP domain-containing histidine kinase [Ornithinimicrobium sp. F0845]